MPNTSIDQTAWATLFNEAHTFFKWQDKPVEEATLRQIYDLVKMGPTSANCQPQRILFVTTSEAKEKLKPALQPGNVDKTMTAPVCAIMAMDMEFYEQLPRLYPPTDARSWYAGNQKAIEDGAFRNATLQAGYFILAARGMGLDCGPMSGFDNAKVDDIFFKGTSWKSNFLCNLGYGVPGSNYDRLPRLTFNEACKIA